MSLERRRNIFKISAPSCFTDHRLTADAKRLHTPICRNCTNCIVLYEKEKHVCVFLLCSAKRERNWLFIAWLFAMLQIEWTFYGVAHCRVLYGKAMTETSAAVMFGNQYLTKTDVTIAETRASSINQSQWVYTLNILIRIFHFVLSPARPPATNCSQHTSATVRDTGESSGTKNLLCLTLIKKLFRPFAVEIRVVGLRPDVSTVTLVWLLNDTRFQTSEKRWKFPPFLYI
jgi:hypothetical protein